MEKIFLLLAFTISALTMAQNSYDEGMQKAFLLWEENKPMEASALFERVAMVQKDNWLPNYYVVLIHASAAFTTKDEKEITALLSKAQTTLDAALDQNPDNAELLVLQAMIHTAWVVYDPMNNGQKLSPVIMQIYEQAHMLDPKNPRVLLQKAQYEMGGAKYFGTDIKPICATLQKALQLFNTFIPPTPFYPDWGKEQAEEQLKACN